MSDGHEQNEHDKGWRRDWESDGDSDVICTDADLAGCGDLSWFCGCGDPPHAAQYLRDVLQNVNDLREERQTYDQFHAAERRMFQHYGAACLIYHLLTHVGLLEHGGAVPGWLTEAGKARLALLQAANLGRKPLD